MDTQRKWTAFEGTGRKWFGVRMNNKTRWGYQEVVERTSLDPSLSAGANFDGLQEDMVPPSRMSATTSGVSMPLASSITSLPFGPLTGLAYGNGLSLMKDYDDQYRVSSIVAGSVLSLVYQYSLDGNILSVSDALNPTTSAQETSGDYAYGEELQERPNVLASISGPQPATFVSDNNGNIVSENTRAYAYDPLNRLITVSEGGTQIASYTYNGLNQRTKKTTQAGTIIYHYDPQGHLVAETDNTGQALVEYIYLDDEPLAMIGDESVFYAWI